MPALILIPKRWFACIIISGLFAGVAFAVDFAGGTGEPNDPYGIATAEQLISIGSDPNLLDKHFVLLNDIDLDPNLPGGQIFTQAVIAADGHPLGGFEGTPFTGRFDGGGHRILNLTIHGGRGGGLALFGCVGKKGVVRDLGIEGSHVNETTGWYDGALVAMNEGRLIRCHAEAYVAGSHAVGILAGFNEGEIIACWAAGEVDGDNAVGGLLGYNAGGAVVNSHADSMVRTRSSYHQTMGGGLVGWNFGGTIVNCCATGDVSAVMSQYLGGLVGQQSAGLVAHCYATGNVSVEKAAVDSRGSGADYLGGLVGHLGGGSIHACYASGMVSGADNSVSLGGLVGQSFGHIADSYAVGRVAAGQNGRNLGGLVGSDVGESRACFWDIETSGLSASAGGATGLTTAQMQDVTTFLTAGWDWVDEQANGTADLWFIPEEGGYPQLTVHSTAYQPYKLEGSGTASDPYRVATAKDLGAINHYDPTACYRLDADIDLAGIAWNKAPIQYLSGRFDGAGRTLFNLMIQGDYCLGLCGILDQNASVVNLGIRNANVMGKGALGMLAAGNWGRIVACHASGVVSGIDGIGGLIGSNGGNISDSYAIGDVTAVASTGVGGLTGWNCGSISRCYAAVHVTSTKSVQGYENVTGGLVGENRGISFLYPPGQVYDSYFLIDSDGGGPDNGFGVPLMDAQMKQQASFVGWDFEGVWMICEGKDYPRLGWEQVDCNTP